VVCCEYIRAVRAELQQASDYSVELNPFSVSVINEKKMKTLKTIGFVLTLLCISTVLGLLLYMHKDMEQYQVDLRQYHISGNTVLHGPRDNVIIIGNQKHITYKQWREVLKASDILNKAGLTTQITNFHVIGDSAVFRKVIRRSDSKHLAIQLN
jgi:hypothetical protein